MIRDIWITFWGKYTWTYNVKQGSGGGRVGCRREWLEKCGLGLANCKTLGTNNSRCFAQPKAWLDSPFPSIYVSFYMPWVLSRFLKMQLF